LKNHVAVFAFDILYLDNESLIKKTLTERRTLLREKMTESKGKFYFAKSSDNNDFDSVE
jgi:DNA ligase-1